MDILKQLFFCIIEGSSSCCIRVVIITVFGLTANIITVKSFDLNHTFSAQITWVSNQLYRSNSKVLSIVFILIVLCVNFLLMVLV